MFDHPRPQGRVQQSNYAGFSANWKVLCSLNSDMVHERCQNESFKAMAKHAPVVFRVLKCALERTLTTVRKGPDNSGLLFLRSC